MKQLESEKRYYFGWGFALLGIALALIVQTVYHDGWLSFGIFLLMVGVALLLASTVKPVEMTALKSGITFAVAGLIVLFMNYYTGENRGLYGVAIAVAILGAIILFIGMGKE